MTLPSGANPKLQELLRRCLEKDPKRRWQAIGDVRVEIESILADPHGLKAVTVVAAKPPLWKRAIPVAVTAILGGLATMIAINYRPAPKPLPIARYSFALAKDQDFSRPARQVLAISHDGTKLVYVANLQLYLKSISEMEAKPIAGSNQDPMSPMFSPDGQWIAFVAVGERKLKKIPLAGGTAVTLADLDAFPFNTIWGQDDNILLSMATAIVRVAGGGGKPETIVKAQETEVIDAPQLLPDGRGLLFTVASRAVAVDKRWDTGQIVVLDLKSGERKTVIQGGSDARYVSTGHLIYAVGATMFAVPFDLKTRQVAGGPVPIVEGVRRSNTNASSATFFVVSDDGTLAWVPGGVAGAARRVLALIDRSGAKKPLALPPAGYDGPRISPDGKHLAVGIADGNDFNIWIYDLDGKTSLRRLTFAGKSQIPAWTLDSKRLVFRSDRDGEGLYWQAADGSGVAERLSTSPNGYQGPLEWTRDGKTLVFFQQNPKTNGGDLWILVPDGDRKAQPLLSTDTKDLRRPSFSPDGHWMTYSSNEENGLFNIYVQPFPPTGAKYKISSKDGGDSPLWTPDGRQIIFAAGRHLMAADVQVKAGFTSTEPKPLPIEIENTQGRPYDITPDGKQFLVMQLPEQQETKISPQINMALNWFQELKQRVPVK
jgi:serine/threonine-protein kinase